MTVVSIYATFASADEAERIGRQMIEERLAACVNILGSSRSIYRWQGAVETTEEVAAIFKTSEARANALIARVTALHSFAVPCVVQWPVDKLTAAYADWVKDSVG
jgi:periplasmic divalent cation tolerance protein